MTRWTGPVIATVDMLLALFIVALALIQPPTIKSAAGDRPICVMAIDIKWKDGLDADVDLWVKGPGDKPVGYSSRAGRIFDLVRDDLGAKSDSDGRNDERACARNLLDGPYVTNVHLYRADRGGSSPITVEVAVSLVNPSNATMAVVWEGEVILGRVGDEITVVRFEMKSGSVLSGTFNNIPYPLRSYVPTGDGVGGDTR